LIFKLNHGYHVSLICQFNLIGVRLWEGKEKKKGGQKN